MPHDDPQGADFDRQDYIGECDYCDAEIYPVSKRTKGAVCETCLRDIGVGERVDAQDGAGE